MTILGASHLPEAPQISVLAASLADMRPSASARPSPGTREGMGARAGDRPALVLRRQQSADERARPSDARAHLRGQRRLMQAPQHLPARTLRNDPGMANRENSRQLNRRPHQ